jgi:hypothetical protein
MEAQKFEVKHNSLGKVKNLSTEQKKLYDILNKLPTPKRDFNLTKDQRKWWYWFGKEFLSTKKLVQGDLLHLQNAAFCLDQRNKIIAKINKINSKDPDGVSGWVQTFPNGTNNVSGYQTSYEKATKQLTDISEYFGLSFTHRQKINSPEAGDPNQLNLLDQIKEVLNG